MWASITAPQAIIISSVLTIAAVVAGILVGAKLVGNRVRELNAALAASNQLVLDHKAKVDASLADFRSRLQLFESLLSSTMNNVGTLQEFTGGTPNQTEAKVYTMAVEATRERLQDDWNAIRDHIEAIASSPSVDGRTRGRYARLDRRRYAELVEALAKDLRLGDRPEDFDKAAAIWSKYRNGGSQPSMLDVATMAQLRKALVPLSLTT
ncbi:hypothetical protein [Mesorhizobium sp. A556]